MFHYKIQVVNRTEFTVKSAERNIQNLLASFGIVGVRAYFDVDTCSFCEMTGTVDIQDLPLIDDGIRLLSVNF
jgi:hypothetical protein